MNPILNDLESHYYGEAVTKLARQIKEEAALRIDTTEAMQAASRVLAAHTLKKQKEGER